MEYSQTTRWLNQMKHKIDSNGNLTEEYIAECRSSGWSEAGIEEEALMLQAKYQEKRKLDEEVPEEWFDFTPYEAIFTEKEREMLNSDGTVRVDYLEKIAGNERLVNEVVALSAEKEEAIEEFYSLVESNRKIGFNYAAYAKANFDEQNNNVLRSMKESDSADLRNFEEISSLTFDVEPDEYQAATQEAINQLDASGSDADDKLNRIP